LVDYTISFALELANIPEEFLLFSGELDFLEEKKVAIPPIIDGFFF